MVDEVPAPKMPNLELDMAAEFLSALGERHAFQTFPDNGGRSRPKSVKGLLRFEEVSERFSLANTTRGVGIHVTVNETDGNGRKLDNIIRPRAVVMDFDHDQNPRGAGALPPSMVVRSRRGPHVYWLLEPQEDDLSRWSRCQAALARKLDADPDCKSLNKTMRVPGFLHHKDSPFLVTLEVCEPSRRYTIDQIVDAWKLDLTPPPPPRPIENLGRMHHDARIRRCRLYVSRCEAAVAGQGGYGRTKGICGIGGDFGLEPDEFFPILLEWNDRCVPPWKEEDLRKKLERVHALRSDPFGCKLDEKPDHWPDKIRVEGPKPPGPEIGSLTPPPPKPPTPTDADAPPEPYRRRPVAPEPPPEPYRRRPVAPEPPPELDEPPPPTDADAPPHSSSTSVPQAPGEPPPPTDADAPGRPLIALDGGKSGGGGGDGSGGPPGGGGKPPRFALGTTSPDGYVMSDLGNAERFVDQMDEWGTQVLYCQAWRKWMCWDKSRWAVDDNNSVRGLLSKSVRSMHNKVNPHDPEDDQKKFARFIQKSENAKSFDNILSQVRHLTPVKTGQLDKNPWLLNCKNGTINLRTGELRKPNRNDLVTKHTPIGYGNRDDECPMWEEYLDIVTGGDRDLQRFLQMAAGYTLSGMTSEQCFFVLYGRGKNGKSTFIEVLAMILGEDYATTASMDSFMEKRYETIRNDLAAMKGMRMVSAVEANQGQKLDEALIKSVTGGDRVSARFMRGEFFSYKPEFKLWLGVNDRPRIGGDDEGIWRRIRLVPFTHAIPVEKRKKDFPERLRRAGELPAIMRWAVEGCLAWLKTGDLNSPESVEAATEEYREEQDIMGTWMRQRCAVGPDYEIASKTLYDDYRDWASENGHRSYSMTNFVTRLKERGFSTRRTNRARFLVGMTLTTPSDD